MSENNDFTSVLRGRAAFYEFLSLAYRKPADEEFITIVKDFIPHINAFAEEADIEELKQSAQKFNELNLDEVTDIQLNSCFTSLFLLGGTSVPTSESVYLSPDKLLKQEPWEEVVKIYRENRFGIPTSFKETEDHISMELLFMFFLCEQSANAIEEDNEQLFFEIVDTQSAFLELHLLKWVPTFSDFVLARKNLVLMDAVTLLLKGYLTYEKMFFDELMAE